jgi:hypothetical protein
VQRFGDNRLWRFITYGDYPLDENEALSWRGLLKTARLDAIAGFFCLPKTTREQVLNTGKQALDLDR